MSYLIRLECARRIEAPFTIPKGVTSVVHTNMLRRKFRWIRGLYKQILYLLIYHRSFTICLLHISCTQKDDSW